MPEDRPRNSLRSNHQLHWYRIEKVLGQGGFGITYLAYDPNLQQPVAIKEYLPMELAVRDGDNSVYPATVANDARYRGGLDRFIAEARTLAKFKHPAIVRVLSVFEDNNTAYMVMEYEHGESLQHVLNGRGTLDEHELIPVIAPILDGLELIHDHGFIHRDIKPSNIYIRENGTPVLIDFGSARQAVGGETKSLTSIVSPGYAPFEQYYSKTDRQGPWTDIYALAATMYRAISGRPPMNAIDRSEAILSAERDTFETASELGRGRYSARFLNALDHALNFNEKQRPQSIAAWRGELGLQTQQSHGLQHLAAAKPPRAAPPAAADDAITMWAADVDKSGEPGPAHTVVDPPSVPQQQARPPAYGGRNWWRGLALAAAAVTLVALLLLPDTVHEFHPKPRQAQSENFAPAVKTDTPAPAMSDESAPHDQTAVLARDAIDAFTAALERGELANAQQQLQRLASLELEAAYFARLSDMLATARAREREQTARKARIEALLSQVADAMTATNDLESAARLLREVLDLDPSNEMALNAIDSIGERYLSAARAAIDAADFSRARDLIGRARQFKVAPLVIQALVDEMPLPAVKLNEIVVREHEAAAATQALARAETERLRVAAVGDAQPAQQLTARAVETDDRAPHTAPVHADEAAPLPRPASGALVVEFDGFTDTVRGRGLDLAKLRDDIKTELRLSGYTVNQDGAAQSPAPYWLLVRFRGNDQENLGFIAYAASVSLYDTVPSAANRVMQSRRQPMWASTAAGVAAYTDLARVHEEYIDVIRKLARKLREERG